MRTAIATASLIVSVLSLFAGYEFLYGGRIATTRTGINFLASEEEAARSGSLNRGPVRPVASLAPGQRVSVIWDTYGKDYWACYVRTGNGKRGWVLCTLLEERHG